MPSRIIYLRYIVFIPIQILPRLKNSFKGSVDKTVPLFRSTLNDQEMAALRHRSRQHGGRSGERGRSALRPEMSAPAPRGHGRTPARRRGHQHHPRMRGARAPQPDYESSPVPSDSLFDDVNSVHSESPVTRTSDDALSNVNCDETESRVSSDDVFLLDEERSAGDGAEGTPGSDDDLETTELARLRCPSVRTELVAERETRKRRRCADYPGFAFGSSIFSSDTMMKFSLIKNELQNIKNTILKRVMSRGARRVEMCEGFCRGGRRELFIT